MTQRGYFADALTAHHTLPDNATAELTVVVTDAAGGRRLTLFASDLAEGAVARGFAYGQAGRFGQTSLHFQVKVTGGALEGCWQGSMEWDSASIPWSGLTLSKTSAGVHVALSGPGRTQPGEVGSMTLTSVPEAQLKHEVVIITAAPGATGAGQGKAGSAAFSLNHDPAVLHFGGGAEEKVFWFTGTFQGPGMRKAGVFDLLELSFDQASEGYQAPDHLAELLANATKYPAAPLQYADSDEGPVSALLPHMDFSDGLGQVGVAIPGAVLSGLADGEWIKLKYMLRLLVDVDPDVEVDEEDPGMG